MKTKHILPLLFPSAVWRKGISLCAICLLATSIFSQSNIQQPTSVNADGSSPDVSAMLDVSATDKGMLVPRMTTVQRTAIAAPATGLLVFDMDTGGFWFYNGTAWMDLSASKTLADADGNTKVQVEKNPNEDIIRFDLGGTESMVLRKNASGATRLELPDGLNNTFVGQGAGNANTTGILNTAYGTQALYSNTTGNGNAANGAFALYSNTTGSSNTANGYYSLYSNTTGSSNTANGNHALYSNTTGSVNTANGEAALYSNTTGYRNTANGDDALYLNTTGHDNTANGENALFLNTTGHSNTANGREALRSNTTGYSNVASGYAAGDEGDNNSNCTAIGTDSDVGIAATSYTNATAIGYDANTTADNYVRIGNTSVNSIGGQVGWSTYSDGRFKRQVQENVAGLDFITRLRPVTYQWDIHALNDFIPNTDNSTEWASQYDIEKIRFTGFIAQEVEQAAADAGFDFSGVDKPQNEFTPYALRYAEFVVPLVKAVQEQQAIIEAQQAKIDKVEKLEAENTALKSLLELQAAQLNKMTAALQGAGIVMEK